MGSQRGARALTSSAVAVVALGGLVLPGRQGPCDLVVLLTASTLVALPLGCWIGALGVRLRPAWAALGTWPAAACLCVAVGPDRQLEPSYLHALAGAVAPSAMLILGVTLGRQGGATAAHLAAVAVLVCAGLPVGGGLHAPRLSQHDPALAALLLDLAPPTLPLEAAGVDWMRHPSIYGPAGTDWFSDRRSPYSALAAAGLLVVAWVLAAWLREPRAGAADDA